MDEVELNLKDTWAELSKLEPGTFIKVRTASTRDGAISFALVVAGHRRSEQSFLDDEFALNTMAASLMQWMGQRWGYGPILNYTGNLKSGPWLAYTDELPMPEGPSEKPHLSLAIEFDQATGKTATEALAKLALLLLRIEPR